MFKRDPQLQTWRFRPVRLWMDDIRELVDIMGCEGTRDVEISAGGHRLTKVDDVDELPTPTRTLDLTSHVPETHGWIQLRIGPDASLELWRVDKIAAAASQHIADVMARCRRPVLGIPAIDLWASLLIALALVFGFPLYVPPYAVDTLGELVAALLWVAAGCLAILNTWRLKVSVIHTDSRVDRPPFLARTKDQLGVSVFAAVAGAVATALAGFILGRIS